MESISVLGREVISLSTLREGRESISFAVPRGAQNISIVRSGQLIEIQFTQGHASERILRNVKGDG